MQMDFSFNINNLLADTVTKLDFTVTPARKNADGHNELELRSQLLQVINQMGEASSKAQGLYTVITTGRKLQLSDHILYVMKDAYGGDRGRGTVVGILKIGRKKLFVYSHHGNVHEMEPLCVLDFYVHESRQRMGCGRKLFDYMLQDTGVKAHHLAIDKPSFKFSQFLRKHYSLRAEIPQVNNFVVFEGFFNNRPDTVPKIKPGFGRPPRHLNKQREPLMENELVRQTSYSGFGLPPLPISNHVQDTRAPNLLTAHNSRPVSGSSVKAHSAIALSSSRRHTIDFPKNGHLQPISATEGDGNEERQTGSESVMPQSKLINSHLVNTQNSPALSRPSSSNILSGGINLSMGTHTKAPSITYSEPLLRRGTISDEYNLTHVNTNNFNLHQDYQGRRGHLKVTSGIEQPARNSFFSQEEEGKRAQLLQPPSDQENWTVFNNQLSYLAISKRNQTHTRLW